MKCPGRCILSLTLQYFVIYTALGITRTVLDFQKVAHDSSGLQKALKHASETMFYAPMVPARHGGGEDGGKDEFESTHIGEICESKSA